MTPQGIDYLVKKMIALTDKPIEVHCHNDFGLATANTLAAISAGRVVAEAGLEGTLENESRANNNAYAQLHVAFNIVNTSAYTDTNRNIELWDAVDGLHGGTAAGEISLAKKWLRDPDDVVQACGAANTLLAPDQKVFPRRIAAVP